MSQTFQRDFVSGIILSCRLLATQQLKINVLIGIQVHQVQLISAQAMRRY